MNSGTTGIEVEVGVGVGVGVSVGVGVIVVVGVGVGHIGVSVGAGKSYIGHAFISSITVIIRSNDTPPIWSLNLSKNGVALVGN
jgi:hypothetical protein